MKIYTKKGDTGTTSTLAKQHILKSSPIFEALGALDELNASLGIIRAYCIQRKKYKSSLQKNMLIHLIDIQKNIINISGVLAGYAQPEFIQKTKNKTTELVRQMENDIDTQNEKINMPTQFIIPGVNEIEAQINMARAICRRAERQTVKYLKKESKYTWIVKFLNRLSDWLFIWGLAMNPVYAKNINVTKSNSYATR